MLWKIPNSYVFTVAAMSVLVAGAIAWRFAFFYAPFAWTKEPARLGEALGLRPGMRIADIGAGSGALALEMASLVGGNGLVYATELDPERRAAIARRLQSAAARHVVVVAGDEHATRLPDACCDAIYMRAVFHHVHDRPAFALSVAQALRPEGRVAVIDFAPGTLWFHGRDHGVDRDAIVRAFVAAGLRVRERADDWGGGMFLVVFEPDGDRGHRDGGGTEKAAHGGTE